MVANPASYAGKPIPAPGANEVVLTIGWGAVGRIDLEPAGCGDPDCDADHGYTGVLAADDFSLRVSAAAEGPEAVAGLLAFADALSARTGECRCPATSRPVRPARLRQRSLGDVLPAVASRARGRRRACGSPWGSSCRRRRSYVVFLVDGLGLRAAPRPRGGRRRSCTRSSAAPATVGVPSTTATSLTSLGTALPPGTHGVVGFTRRIPGTDDLLNALHVEQDVDPREWQPHPTAFARLAAAGRAHDGGQQARVRRLRADRRRPGARSSSAPTGSGSGWRRCSAAVGRSRR